jgi:5-methylcytosine-specific restriction endonuclease McrA
MNNFFINYYKKNNRLIANIPFKYVLQHKIIIPNEQRIRDDDKVKEIVEVQDSYKKKYGHFNFLNLINIHQCNNKYYLVDGQHRYTAMKRLYSNHGYNDLNIDIELTMVENMEELKYNYAMINKNTELPEFPDDIDKNIPEKVAQFFFMEYPDIWTTKKRNIRPFLNKNNFQEAIGYLLSKINKNCKELNKELYDVEDLKSMILEKNERMSNWQVDIYIKNIRKIKKWPEYLEICNQHKFYLGMYSHMNEEYCYDWVKDIVREYTGENLKKAPKKKNKKKIPKNLKNQVWNVYNDKKKAIAKCYCCNIEELHITSWHCGHVVAEDNGGLLTVENLRPICSNCNLTMGTQNLYNFMEKYYPDRYKNLKEKSQAQVKAKANKYFFF